MAGASSGPFFGLGDTQMQPQGSSQPQNSLVAPDAAAPPKNKKRNSPGNPKPDSEVIALSPQTLMATNRFVCEVCHKGFQRYQNLQLHLRGHGLPWMLKQKNPEDSRRRVYLCPEPTCVHHHPSRALGDLTGIKKHYCRKHGKKTLKCNKCNKLYAVESDWKAHTKICGTREYRCDCGSVFSRKDSFINHSTYCSGAPHESAQLSSMGADLHVGSGSVSLGLSGGDAQIHGFADEAQSSSAAAAAQFDFFDHIMPSSPGPSMFRSQASASSSSFFLGGGTPSPAQDFSEDGEYSQGQGSSLLHGKQPFHGLIQLPEQQHQPGSINANGNLLNLGFFPGNSSGSAGGSHSPARDFSEDGENFQGGQGSSLLHGKQPFHGLMQHPEHQYQPGSSNVHSNLLNLGFFPGNSDGSAGDAYSPARDFSGDGENFQGGHGSYLLHGKHPFHGLMHQLPEQQHQPGSSNAQGNLLNLGFYSGNNGGSAGGQDARLVIQEQYYNGSSGGSNANCNLLNLGFFSGNSGGSANGQNVRPVIQDQFDGIGGSSNAEHGGVMAPIGSHHSGGFPYQYNSSPSAGSALNSATALLMKAAQVGSMSSAHNSPSALLRAAGFNTASSDQGTSRDEGERASHAAHFHDLIMNSLPRGGGGFSDGGAAGFGATDDGTLSTRDFLGALGPGQDEGRYDGSFRE